MISSPYTETLAVTSVSSLKDRRLPDWRTILPTTIVKNTIASIGKHKALPIDANFCKVITDLSGICALVVLQAWIIPRKVGQTPKICLTKSLLIRSEASFRSMVAKLPSIEPERAIS
jgi:hypothetical protein